MKEALQYRRMGYTYQQVGETMHISQSSACRYVTEAIQAIPREAAEVVCMQMVDRLARMLQPLMRSVEEDAADSSTVSAILQIEGRRARLLGIHCLADFGDDGEDLVGAKVEALADLG